MTLLNLKVRRWPRVGVHMRLSVALVSLFMALLLLMDLVFGIFPDPDTMEFHNRRQASYGLASVLVATSETETVPPRRALAAVATAARWNPDIVGVALRDEAQAVRPILGDPQRFWTLDPGEPSTPTQVRVPLTNAGAPAGALEVAFRPLHASGWHGLLSQPILRALLGLALGCTVLAYLYLRRALHQIDPGRVVPERVRDAFDVLQQGVMVLDQRHRVMMGNDALMRLCPPGAELIPGGPVSQLGWLLDAIDAAGARRPWEAALAEGGVTPELVLDLPARGDEAARHVTLAATPIFDNGGRARGTLVTATDVTPLHRLNAELEQSREALRRQNEHLHKLATRDPLTNCLNRRAFFERGEALLAGGRANGVLGCIMVDIDHFKQVNDHFGHGVGDIVIRAVASVLDRVSRPTDLVCRYGGEEFCVLVLHGDVGTAPLLANRMRAEIENSAGSSVDEVPGMRVTASIGVALWQPDCGRLLDLIGRADDALYHSKRGGRNRVTAWHAELKAPAAESATA